MINIRLLVQVILLIAQGIFEALRSARRFEELEEKIQRLVHRAALILLEEALDQVDRRLCAARDVKRLKVIGLRSRTIVTSFGELSFKRRLYRDKDTGEYRFLLDETLGLEASRRLNHRIKELILELGTEKRTTSVGALFCFFGVLRVFLPGCRQTLPAGVFPEGFFFCSTLKAGFDPRIIKGRKESAGKGEEGPVLCPGRKGVTGGERVVCCETW
ncbi:MAG: UPF0236 family transposase-like protein [Bacillota bacterium]